MSAHGQFQLSIDMWRPQPTTAQNDALSELNDVRIAWNAGRGGARLASSWMDAMIAGASRGTAAGSKFNSDRVTAVERPALPPTDPGRYGWRFWALRPDGMLVTPFAGTEIHCGTFHAECSSCAEPPGPQCGCGIHYMLRARDIHRYADGSVQFAVQHRILQRIRDGEWAPALAYGVAVGAVEVDRSQYQNVDAPSRRAAGWPTLAIVAPAFSRAVRASLRERYGCQVTTDASLRTCELAAVRLE
jgi:hypothetical protein